MTDPFPRPSFAKERFEHAELEELVTAFARGNFAFVREKGAALASRKDESDEIRQTARDIVDRTQPDPWAKFLFVVAALLLLVVASYWILQRDTKAHAPRVPASAQKP